MSRSLSLQALSRSASHIISLSNPKFFTLTGLCYVQAMPMVWRVLYTLENIIEQEGIDIGLSKLSQMYNLFSHGSHRFLLKHKPGQAHPILKNTKNDSNWRNQFFIVRKDSILNGNHLPKKWITQGRIWDPWTRTTLGFFFSTKDNRSFFCFSCAAISFSSIQESHVTKERIAAF
ncbi:hypothetical protein Hanom_Chr07g00633661 [Helianthus anomalus]